MSFPGGIRLYILLAVAVERFKVFDAAQPIAVLVDKKCQSLYDYRTATKIVERLEIRYGQRAFLIKAGFYFDYCCLLDWIREYLAFPLYYGEVRRCIVCFAVSAFFSDFRAAYRGYGICRGARQPEKYSAFL